jgi:hypothetical protein
MAALAGILTLMVMVAVALVWWVGTVSRAGVTVISMGPGPPLGSWLGILYHSVRLLLYGLAALLVAGYCQLHFDRLAGRSSASPFRRARRRAPWSRVRKTLEGIEADPP